MIHHALGPPRTLSERLEQLNNNLQSMGERLKEAIASAIGTTVAEAVRDAVQGLLGSQETAPCFQDNRWDDRRREESRWSDDDRGWGEEPWNGAADDPWQERDYEERQLPHQGSGPLRTQTTHLRNALSAAVQASLWWLREQKKDRPVLTTSVVALAAGVTAFFYGPVLAAGVGTLASIMSLFLTADSTRSAAERVANLADD